MEKGLRTHSLAHELITRAMTKEELDKKMDQLSDSEYRNNWRDSAMCYSIAPPIEQSCKIICSKCGCESKLIYTADERNINLSREYDKFAAEFVALGYEAKTDYYCENCVAEDPDHLSPVTFSFYAYGMLEPVISYPCPHYFYSSDYRLAIDFLKGADCAGTLNDLFKDKEQSQYRYIKRIKSIIGPEPQHNKPRPDNRKESFPF